MSTRDYFHVNVFGTSPFSGNGLTVFLDCDQWSPSSMLRMTREMKHFESIFLRESNEQGAHARIFTVDEELPFAGHPSLGAAAVLHRVHVPNKAQAEWTLRLPARDIALTTKNFETHFVVEMNQGLAHLGPRLESSLLLPLLNELGLRIADLDPRYAARLASTGLPYLALALRSVSMSNVQFSGHDIGSILSAFDAKFLFVLDVDNREIRTWDNRGRVEDVATGSAAGPALAFMIDEKAAEVGRALTIRQGRFAGRPCELVVRAEKNGSICVGGQVWPVARGCLDLPLETLRAP